MFGFLPIGTQFVSKSMREPGLVKITKFRCCCCNQPEVTEFKLQNSLIKVRLHLCNIFNILMAFVISFAFAFFLHFVPCIWWSCDMGYYDGEQIRGYIWFISWPCFFVLFLIFGMMCYYLQIELRPSEANLGSKAIWVSIGNDHVFIPKNFNLNAITRTGSTVSSVSSANEVPQSRKDSLKVDLAESTHIGKQERQPSVTKIEIDYKTLNIDSKSSDQRSDMESKTQTLSLEEKTGQDN